MCVQSAPSPFPIFRAEAIFFEDEGNLLTARRTYNTSLGMISVLIIAALSLPLIYICIRAYGSGQEGLEYLQRPRTRLIFTNTLRLTVAVVLVSGFVGTVFAWLTTRTNLPFRRVILVLGLIPMVIPSYVGSLTLVQAFGPVGYLQGLLEEPFGIKRLPPIYGLRGAALAVALFTYPYFVLPVRAALLNADRGLEEAAQSLGSSRLAIFWRITLPMLRPSLAAGALLTALYTISDFGAVMVMRYNVFSRAIYLAYDSSFNRHRAALLALVLVVTTLILVWLERRATDTAATYRIGKGAVQKAELIRLSIVGQITGLLFCTILIGIGVILPVGILLDWAINPEVISPIDMQLETATWNAITTSLMAAAVAGIVAFPLALFSKLKTVPHFMRGLTNFAYVGNALPGVAIGLALVFFGANQLPALYQTLPLLIFGYTVRFLPFSLASTRSALAGLNPALEEAAQGLGLNAWQRLLRVTIPLTWTGIMAGMALVFLNTMKELPTTLMLSPIGFITPATRIWTAYESGRLALVGLPGLILIGASFFSLLILLGRTPKST